MRRPLIASSFWFCLWVCRRGAPAGVRLRATAGTAEPEAAASRADQAVSTVAVTPPGPLNDPGFVALRKQLADVAAKKDRAALAKLVVAQNFFWVQDKDLADPHKSGIDNLAKAIDLDAKDGSGWDTLAGYANEPTAAELPQQKGVFCAPADPTIDPQKLEALGKATGTDPSEWGYANKDGVELHQTAKPNSPVVEKLGRLSGARAARYRPRRQPERSAVPAHRGAGRQNRLCRRATDLAARQRPDVLCQRCAAAGRSPAISAAPRSETTRAARRRHHDTTIAAAAGPPHK